MRFVGRLSASVLIVLKGFKEQKMPINRILVVMDDFDAGAYLTDLLKWFGFKTDWSYNWALASLLVEENSYDVLLLDGWLAHDASNSPIKWLRDKGHQFPVILLSDSLTHPHEKPYQETICKSITPSQLRRVLESVIGRREQDVLVAQGAQQ